MCGCMLMHAGMNHDQDQHSTRSMPQAGMAASPSTGGRSCRHCGFSLGRDFKYCPNCGMSLEFSKCPACGQKVEANWGACAYCGHPLGEAEKEKAA